MRDESDGKEFPASALRPKDASLRRARLIDTWVARLLRLAAWACVLVVILLGVVILAESLPVFWEAEVIDGIGGLWSLGWPSSGTVEQSAQFAWRPHDVAPQFNLVPLFAATLKITLIALSVGVPIALGAATFSSLYAPPMLGRLLRVAFDMLAGLPTVVLGFGALYFVAPLGPDMQAGTGSAWVAGITLSFAVIPLVFIFTETEFRSVPEHVIRASIALGARKWQLLWYILWPSARPGIVAAIVLSIGRVVGESMVALLAAGATSSSNLLAWGVEAQTPSAMMVREFASLTPGEPLWRVLFVAATLSMALTIAIRRLGRSYVARSRARLSGRPQ